MKHSIRAAISTPSLVRLFPVTLISTTLFAVTLFAAPLLAAPMFPPVPWGHERIFYDVSGHVVGGIVACEVGGSSWGTYTQTYIDRAIDCP